MKIYLEKVYDVDNIRAGIKKLIIHKAEPIHLKPSELMEIIEAQDCCEIISEITVQNIKCSNIISHSELTQIMLNNENKLWSEDEYEIIASRYDENNNLFFLYCNMDNKLYSVRVNSFYDIIQIFNKPESLFGAKGLIKKSYSDVIDCSREVKSFYFKLLDIEFRPIKNINEINNDLVWKRLIKHQHDFS